MNSATAVKKLLNDTENQIVRYLKRAPRLQGAYEIQSALGIPYANTVYRALEKLLQLGLVHRIESQNAFTACDDPNKRHNPGFIICTDCGTVEEFSIEAILPLLQSEAADRKFVFEKSTIELTGHCSRCSNHVSKRRLGAIGH